MLIENTLYGKEDKVLLAVKRLQLNEPPEGYYVAFSGGKDSCVVLDLCKRAGVKYDAHFNVTTVDPPEVLRFVHEYHPDENVILSLGGTMGNGNPMVNAGVTFKLGPKGHAVLSRTALTNALRKEQEKNKVAMAQIQGLNSKVERLESLVQTLMAKADK